MCSGTGTPWPSKSGAADSVAEGSYSGDLHSFSFNKSAESSRTGDVCKPAELRSSRGRIFEPAEPDRPGAIWGMCEPAEQNRTGSIHKETKKKRTGGNHESAKPTRSGCKYETAGPTCTGDSVRTALPSGAAGDSREIGRAHV